MNSKEPMAYIATKECSCIVASMLKDAIDKKVLGKLVAEWVAAGYNIEYVAHSYVLENWQLCDHGHKQIPLTEDAARATERAIERLEQSKNGHGGDMSYTVAEDGTVGDVAMEGEAEEEKEIDPATLYQGTKQLILEGYTLFAEVQNLDEIALKCFAFAQQVDGGEPSYSLDTHEWDSNENQYFYDRTTPYSDIDQLLTDMVNIAPFTEWHVEGETPAEAETADIADTEALPQEVEAYE